MEVAVIGATGRTGRRLVEELLNRGHAVRALARDPARLGELADRVDVVTGDSRDRAVLRTLLTGADAVVSALGPTAKESSLHTDTARALVEVMPAVGVRRFVGVSGAGIDVPGDRKSTSAKVISALVRRIGSGVAGDKVAEHTVLAASDLDWTLVRPPRLLDRPGTGRVEHDAHRSTRSTWIGRTDLSRFLVDVLEQDLYVRQAPFVASAP